MGSLSRTGICLIAVLAIALSGLVAQLLYVLWCRRRFQTQNLNSDRIAPHHHDHHHHHATTTTAALSKDLLYFFLCWHHHSRIGPTAAAAGAPPFSAAGPSPGSGDLSKWHGLHGLSRALFTIDEDEREDPGWPEGPEVKKMKRVSLEERFAAAEDGGVPPVLPAPALDETPFSTPCESPVFYTPSPSPPREAATSHGNDVMVDLEVGEL